MTEPKDESRAVSPPSAQLGPLPETSYTLASGGSFTWVRGWDEKQVRAYAAQEVAAERERIGDALLKMHERDGARHNYWLCAWRELFGA